MPRMESKHGLGPLGRPVLDHVGKQLPNSEALYSLMWKFKSAQIGHGRKSLGDQPL
jgi:hypothetical protein